MCKKRFIFRRRSEHSPRSALCRACLRWRDQVPPRKSHLLPHPVTDPCAATKSTHLAQPGTMGKAIRSSGISAASSGAALLPAAPSAQHCFCSSLRRCWSQARLPNVLHTSQDLRADSKPKQGPIVLGNRKGGDLPSSLYN